MKPAPDVEHTAPILRVQDMAAAAQLYEQLRELDRHRGSTPPLVDRSMHAVHDAHMRRLSQ
ncbi:MAG: hypothetical protein OXT09_20750 [Myxococcales bacterium]|nr:hypothetical protein [Myxococcales bacterium]